MKQIWMRAGALGLALGALGLVMVQAGLSSCGTTTRRPETSGESQSPPITTKASESPATEPTAAETAEEPPVDYMPATKSGSIHPRWRSKVRQQSASKGE
jgi:hypothetical protein